MTSLLNASTTFSTPEPAEVAQRPENHPHLESYLDAVEEGVEQDDEGHRINVHAIKESPPRPSHMRHGSEPRPLDEVMDELGGDSLRSSSPTLRHPRGRLEDAGSGIWEGERTPTKIGGFNDHDSAVQLMHNGKTDTSRNSSDTFEGVGKDEAPRSPVRSAHKRVSSRSLNGNSNMPQSPSKPGAPPVSPNGAMDEKIEEPGKLVYENLRNKSGDNLASVKPFGGYDLSLQQREDEPLTSERLNDAQRQRASLESGKIAGSGWGRSAIRFAPWNVPLQRRLQTLMVLLHTLSIVGGLAIFFFLCTIPLLWPILLPYLLYVLLSRAPLDGKLAYRSEWWRRSKIWSLFASYFPARLHRTQTLEEGRKYVFAYHPHGIISHGAFAAFATEALGFSQLFPGITNSLLTLDANFRIPLYREYALFIGLQSVSRESCENILTKGGRNGEGMGRAITIVIGGARESLEAMPYTLRLVLKRRKGFVKLAIRTGADLVPVLAFGENDLYDQFDAKKSPLVHKGQLMVKRFMGFTVPLFHARGVFNYDVGMMPYRRPINIVVGRSIPIIQHKTPDPAYVDEIHQKYVDELLRIWDDWKDTFSPNRKSELEMIE